MSTEKTAAAICFYLLVTAFAFSQPIRLEFQKIDDDAPEGWVYKGKLGTNDVQYTIQTDQQEKRKVLKISCHKGSGVILYDISKIDLKRYPILRWRWKVDRLPAGADARVKGKDDQGIAIYVGFGKIFQESISYTWQTETPKGMEGNAVYNKVVSVKWYSLRNKSDETGVWFTEQRNLHDDLMRQFKKIPSKLALSISSNSQYTGTDAVSYIDYIEFAEK